MTASLGDYHDRAQWNWQIQLIFSFFYGLSGFRLTSWKRMVIRLPVGMDRVQGTCVRVPNKDSMRNQKADCGGIGYTLVPRRK